jgi:cell division protein FtsQ
MVKKSQSPLVGSKRRRYRQRRVKPSNTFRNFRASFGGLRRPLPSPRVPLSLKEQLEVKEKAPLLHLVGKIGLRLALLGLLVFALVQGYKILEAGETFRLRKIVVQGHRVAHEHEILTRAALKPGLPLLGFQSVEAEARIRQHPWIQGVRMQRSWPSTLIIQVEEHRPLAMINLEGAGGLYYIDEQGKIFAPVEPTQERDFPVLTGLNFQGKPEESRFMDDELAAEAVHFLRLAALGNPIVPLQALSEIHVTQEKGIILYLAERPFPIYLGYGNIRTRYYQLVRLLERLYDRGTIENIKEIRMDYKADRILVARLEP